MYRSLCRFCMQGELGAQDCLVVDLSTLRLDPEAETSLSTSVASIVNEYLAMEEDDRTSIDSSRDGEESDSDANGVEIVKEGEGAENGYEDEETPAAILTFGCAREEAKALAKILIDLVKGSRGELGVK